MKDEGAIAGAKWFAGRVIARARAWWAGVLELPGVARSVRTLVVVASGMRGEPIALRAGALTYLTALSLVPLLAVSFSIFQAVVGTDRLQAQLRDYVLHNLAVGAQKSFAAYIDQYVQRATATALGGIGFVVLLVSAISLLANLEAAFNHTFRAPRPRPLVVRFGVYWCLLTLGPILLAVSVAGTAMLQASRAAEILGISRRAFALAPTLITYAAFALLYLIVPAVPVKRRAAVLGALVAGTAFEIAKVVYTWASAHSVRRDAIYGSLSAIPAFLLWTYVSWLILLFGARVAYAAQASHAELEEHQARSPLGRELFGARVLLAVARAFANGEPPPDERALALSLSAPEGMVRGALKSLSKGGLVRRVADGPAGGWMPARSPATIRLSDARRALRGEVGFDTLGRVGAGALPPEPSLAELARHWRCADDAADRLLEVTLVELAESRAPADDERTPIADDRLPGRPPTG